MPVLVARMSVSFSVLFRSVPLYAIHPCLDEYRVVGSKDPSNNAIDRQNEILAPTWITRLPLPPKILPEVAMGRPPSRVSAIAALGFPRLK
jgi:hypothetical protein